MSTDATHPDFEDLSAHFDGEAPEVAAHVAVCAECRTTLKWLRTASSMVAAPVPPAPASVRDQAIARAGDVFETQPKTAKGFGEADAAPSVSPTVRPPATSRPAASGRRLPLPGPESSRPADSGRPAGAPVPITAGRRNRARGGSGVWVGVGSAAAVIVAVLVGVSALGGSGGSDETDTLAAGPTQERTTTLFAGDSSGAAAAPGAPDADAAGGVNAGDLGELPDSATLVARARPVLTQRQAALAAPDAAPTAGISSSESAPQVAPKAVGTRPCEMEARTAHPGLGTVVYFATGRVAGVPVIVLGFEPGLPPADVTLLALAQQEGCRVVLEAAGP